jgi:threonyl-tRNA synthetase
MMSDFSSTATPTPPTNEWTDWLNSLNWIPVSPDEYKALSPEDQLVRIRHSAAHLMAHAIQDLRPEAQFAIGPATPQGFFYDIRVESPLKEEDLTELENLMAKVAGKSVAFEVTSIPKLKAIELFQSLNQPHKLDILNKSS